MNKTFIVLFFLFGIFLACDENHHFVVFSVQDDVNLGKQVQQEIANDPTHYKILPESSYPQVYSYLNGMKDAILNSGEIAYKDEFAWDLYVLEDDTTLNAFATPGGYIYIYSGLIKYLDHADDLAGVLGHEMAHADQRHSVRNLQKTYGVEALLAIALGQNPNALEQIAGQIAGQLAGLQFSREYETDADTHSVQYLAHTKYACNGAALFFIKLEEAGNSNQPPEFLSTHPNPENRIENINNQAAKLKCSTALSGDTGYDQIKSSLP
jgi:predicted Zn-dependent protease